MLDHPLRRFPVRMEISETWDLVPRPCPEVAVTELGHLHFRALLFWGLAGSSRERVEHLRVLFSVNKLIFQFFWSPLKKEEFIS